MNALDRTFAALADPTRRAILGRLAQGEAMVGELAEPFAISLPAVSRHLKVLEQASLITNVRDGKHRRCRINPAALSEASRWFEFYARFWTGSLDRLDTHLNSKERVKVMSSAPTPVQETGVLAIKRVFNAPPQRVFDAWTQREQWQAWIGPEGVNCDVPELDARVGGRYRVMMRLTDGRTLPVGGEFKIVDAPRTLAFTWAGMTGTGHETLVVLSFRDLGGRTELTLRHENLPADMIAGHDKGWSSALNKLGAYLLGA
jgi:uncharacterized protein YndB with AHSA1/START domain/DNA-binding transcriptional ArsR family regulator